MAQNKNSGRKGPSRGTVQECAPHERGPCAQNWGKNTWGNLVPRTMRPWSSMELGEKYLQTQEWENCYVLDFSESQGNARAHSKMSRRARTRSRCRSINAHAEQKNKLTRAGHVAKIQKPDWEEQVFVHDLDLFVTNAITQRNACCSIAWKLCEDHGYSYGWVSGQKPR